MQQSQPNNQSSATQTDETHLTVRLKQLQSGFIRKSSFYAMEIRIARARKFSQDIIKDLRSKRSKMDKCASIVFNMVTGHTPYTAEEFNRLMDIYREF
jgi:hypothetical protein